MVTRDVYTIGDVLSDVGGLASVIGGVLSFTLSIINHANFDTNFAAKLYRIQTDVADAAPSEPIRPGDVSSLKEFLISLLP